MTVQQSVEGPALVRLKWSGMVKSELLKLWTMPQTAVLYAAAVLVLVGFGAAAVGVAAMDADEGIPPMDVLLDPTHMTMSGTGLAQILVAVLGVLAFSSEYGTGTVRSTLVAAPRRGGLLLAKAVVLAGSTFVVTAPAALAAFLVNQPALESVLGTQWPLDEVVLRAVVGAGGYMAGIALLGLAFGVLLKYSAAGVALVFGVVFVLPMAPMVLPQEVGEKVGALLPASAGSQLMKVPPPDALLTVGTGGMVFGAYVVAALVAAWFVLTRRDTH